MKNFVGEQASPGRLVVPSATDTIALKQLVVADAPVMSDLIEHDRAHLSQFGDLTADKYPSMEAVIASIIKPKDPSRLRFGVWDDDQMVGSINLTPDKDNKEGTVGYWVGGEYTGHHYAARATRLLAQYAFGPADLSQLYAEVVRDNEASALSLERAGFNYAGMIKKMAEDGSTAKYWCLERLNPAHNRMSIQELNWPGETEPNAIGFLTVNGISQWLVNHRSVAAYRVPASAGPTAYEIFGGGKTITHMPEPGKTITVPIGTPLRFMADEVMIQVLNPRGTETTKLIRYPLRASASV